MNPQLSFVSNKQFWFGVAATITIGVLISIGIPNFMRVRFSPYEFNEYGSTTRLVREMRERTNTAKTVALVAPVQDEEDRRLVRTGSMEMLVKDPNKISEKIRVLAEQAGGFLVSSETYNEDNGSGASLTIRIPAKKFDLVRSEIADLSLRIENEKLQAEDVSKQYVDQDARLRNLRAQETQYLGILRQAKTVRDTMEVSSRLNQVRGEIEQQQDEFDALSKQVETVALTISLRAEADTQVFGLNWRPLYQIKIAAKQGLAGLGDYAATMASFLFYLPTILLWLATILISAAIGWRILRWAGRILFVQRVRAA